MSRVLDARVRRKLELQARRRVAPAERRPLREDKATRLSSGRILNQHVPRLDVYDVELQNHDRHVPGARDEYNKAPIDSQAFNAAADFEPLVCRGLAGMHRATADKICK
jgi:hypothetical protein